MINIIADILKSLRIVLTEALSSFRRNNDLTSASSLAFSAALALIPALFLLTTLIGAAVGSSAQALAKMEELTTQFIPTFSGGLMREVRFITNHRRAIGLLNVSVLFFTIMPLVSDMRIILGSIFRKRRERPYLLEKLIDMAIIIVFITGVSAVAVAGVVFSLVEKHVPLHAAPKYLTGASPFIFVTLTAFSLYYAFNQRVRPLHLLTGALTTSLLWFAMRPAFTLFLTYNPGYGLAFGSFKSLFVVIIWIYYSLAVFLFGAELAAVLKRKELIYVKRLMERGRSLPETALRKLVTAHEKGGVIFKTGDPGREIFSVHKGSVAIKKEGKVIRVIKEGEYFGDISSLLNVSRMADAIALEDSEIITISGRTALGLLREYPDLALDALKRMAMRLQDANLTYD